MSLLELAIVVTIIGILAALAIPGFAKILNKSRLTTLSNDLRIHKEAFQTYALEEGEYPASFASHGAFVPGLEQLLSVKWLEGSPVGGSYEWEYTNNPDPAQSNAFIEIVETGNRPFSIGLADVVKLDEQIDDGNLATGYLQVAGTRIRYFVQLGGS